MRTTTLTAKELDALRLIAAGTPQPAAAQQLGITGASMVSRLQRAYSKLGAQNGAEAVAEARRRGLL